MLGLGNPIKKIITGVKKSLSNSYPDMTQPGHKPTTYSVRGGHADQTFK